MKDHFWAERWKRLEEEFLPLREAALLALRRLSPARRRAACDALAAASRIKDETLLDQLAAMGINPDTLTVLSLVPLVEVAWADGTVEAEERDAILAAAQEAGLQSGGSGHRLLESCLSEQPQPQLHWLWEQYIKHLCATLSAAEKEALQAEVMQRAQIVASAAGELVGTGSRISASEARLMADIKCAFDA